MENEREDEQLSVEDIRKAFDWWARADRLHLISVRVADRITGTLGSVNLDWLRQSGICWLAMQARTECETFLFAQLYAEKFHKLARSSNRSGRGPRFETRTRVIERPEAVSFVANATHYDKDLVRATLNRLLRDEQQTLRMLRHESAESAARSKTP